MDASYIDLIIRLTLALVLGGAIGIEREYRAKEAGFRTHFLVALGSALFCVVSQYGFGVDLKDSSRVAAQVVSGIGFLGAGTIIFQKNVVRGLTTAAPACSWQRLSPPSWCCSASRSSTPLYPNSA